MAADVLKALLDHIDLNPLVPLSLSACVRLH